MLQGALRENRGFCLPEDAGAGAGADVGSSGRAGRAFRRFPVEVTNEQGVNDEQCPKRVWGGRGSR